MPADWSTSVNADGDLLLANRGHSANFSLNFVPSAHPREALDQLARAILGSVGATVWDSREPAEISGCRGFRYTARVRPAGGAEVRAEIVLVAVGEDRIASASMLLARRMDEDAEVTARLAFAALRLVAP